MSALRRLIPDINFDDGRVSEEKLAALLVTSADFIAAQAGTQPSALREIVTHLSDRVAVMYLGRIVETGPTPAVFASPRHPYTQALLKAHPDVRAARSGSPALTGEIPSNYDIPAGCRFHTRCRFAEPRCRTIDPPGTTVSPGHVVHCHVLPAPDAG
jgi:oligopeptide/dipeptide ABC transporter ATP-binding protein